MCAFYRTRTVAASTRGLKNRSTTGPCRISIGTTRVVELENNAEELPRFVRRYLDMASPDHSVIYGDFGICPLKPDQPGHMRAVGVAGAEKLVVQNLRRSRPPFRLLSTWPTSD